MATIDAVLFDLDGTLIDTNEIIITSYLHAFHTCLPEVSIDRQTIIDAIGPPLHDTFARYTNSEALIKQCMQTYREYYMAHEHECFELYPGVIETLQWLRQRRIKTAIVTTKFKAAALPSMQHFGIDRLVDAMISLDDVDHPKPDKEPVTKALMALHPVNQAIMVGDNQSDILAGQAAGTLTAGVAWSIHGPHHFDAVAPDFMLEKLSDLQTILKMKGR